jgi:hypothetical protein
MIDAPPLTTVSLSRKLVTETPRHLVCGRDSAETPGEAADLQALARLVLARDTRRDSNRDRVSRAPRLTELPARQSASALTRAKEGEPLAETPAFPSTTNTVGNQSLKGVSPSRVLESETPETPLRVPSSRARGSTSDPTSQHAPSRGNAEEERVAIGEYDGGIPRAWAEGFGRLHPDRPPGDVPPKRWQRFVDDAGQFLESPFCAVAAALGWGSYDLFGCDRDRPFARIDHAGLLWLLNGDRLIALTENTATIETRTGARQTFRRKPNEPGRVLAWQLAE